jgi:FkbM family methyltransferase
MFQRAAKSLLEFYAGRTPYHRGKWRVVEAMLGFSGVEKLDRGKSFPVSRLGLKWRLTPDCAVQRRLLYHGAFDVHDVRELMQFVRTDSVFFDVGAYFGYYSMLAALRTKAEIFAFEPVRANYELLVAHRELNGLENVQPFQLALSDEVGEVRFAIAPGSNRGTGHLAMEPGDSSQEMERVQATTLDHFVDVHQVSRIDLMKLDVEGAELQVLAGGSETIRRHRPVLLVEVNGPCLRRFGRSESELIAGLRSFGYQLYRARAGGLVKFDGLAAGEDYTNVICRPE